MEQLSDPPGAPYIHWCLTSFTWAAALHYGIQYGFGGNCLILFDPAWSYLILLDLAWSCMILLDLAWSCLISLDLRWSCLILLDLAWSCLIKGGGVLTRAQPWLPKVWTGDRRIRVTWCSLSVHTPRNAWFRPCVTDAMSAEIQHPQVLAACVVLVIAGDRYPTIVAMCGDSLLNHSRCYVNSAWFVLI